MNMKGLNGSHSISKNLRAFSDFLHSLQRCQYTHIRRYLIHECKVQLSTCFCTIFLQMTGNLVQLLPTDLFRLFYVILSGNPPEQLAGVYLQISPIYRNKWLKSSLNMARTLSNKFTTFLHCFCILKFIELKESELLYYDCFKKGKKYLEHLNQGLITQSSGRLHISYIYQTAPADGKKDFYRVM